MNIDFLSLDSFVLTFVNKVDFENFVLYFSSVLEDSGVKPKLHADFHPIPSAFYRVIYFKSDPEIVQVFVPKEEK